LSWLAFSTLPLAFQHFNREHFLQQCVSTGVPRNLRVPQVAGRGSAETNQIFLELNSQPQFYAVVAIETLGSLRRVQ